MNIEEFPEDIKNDIEDQSLSIFDAIKDDVIVIGGWAVRAHLGEDHHRYTLDVDGVTDKETLDRIKRKILYNEFIRRWIPLLCINAINDAS